MKNKEEILQNKNDKENVQLIEFLKLADEKQRQYISDFENLSKREDIVTFCQKWKFIYNSVETENLIETFLNSEKLTEEDTKNVLDSFIFGSDVGRNGIFFTKKLDVNKKIEMKDEKNQINKKDDIKPKTKKEKKLIGNIDKSKERGLENEKEKNEKKEEQTNHETKKTNIQKCQKKKKMIFYISDLRISILDQKNI